MYNLPIFILTFVFITFCGICDILETSYIYTFSHKDFIYNPRPIIFKSHPGTRMLLRCKINLSASAFCENESLVISPTGSISHSSVHYCGNKSFRKRSQSNFIEVAFSSTSNGTFRCKIKAYYPNKKLQCGNGQYKVDTFKDPIKGGTNVKLKDFPFMAGLIDTSKSNSSIFAGATIISSKYLITAKHVFESSVLENLKIIVGTCTFEGGDLSRFPIYTPIKTFFFENCTDTNDIALVKINGTFKFDDLVYPACIPFSHKHNDFNNENLIALGWGSESLSGPTSKQLKMISLPVVNNTYCKMKHEKTQYDKIDDTILCTFGKGDVDTCVGDSGGPLFWLDKTIGKWYLVGITSEGVGCGSDLPSINVRITAYLKWIKNIVINN